MPLLKITDPFLRLAKKCQKFANSKRCSEYFKNFYLRPLPTRDTYVDSTDIVSIDFATTGVDLLQDYVLSIGGIEINKGAIDFITSFHYYVNNSSFIKKDAAIINQITPEQLLEG